MTVASLELSQRLYEVSGWGDTDFVWAVAHEGDHKPYLRIKNGNSYAYTEHWAYDLGFLLRKLPARYWQESEKRWDALHLTKWDRLRNGGVIYTAEYWTVYNAPFKVEADTPEDAAVKLCLELFEQGVLHKGGEKS